jgi:hypothetical protein
VKPIPSARQTRNNIYMKQKERKIDKSINTMGETKKN